jgi:hypothetical protein
MFRVRTALISTAMAFGVLSAPALAKPDAEDIANALAILGVAALTHNQNHYQEGRAPSGAQETADFERGYRDGLHNFDYDAGNSAYAYGDGYSAGMKERENRSAPRRSHSAGTSNTVPHDVLRGCAGAVADAMGVGIHDVHVVASVKRGENDYLVEAAVGHKHMTCAMDGVGVPQSVVDGRMQ